MKTLQLAVLALALSLPALPSSAKTVSKPSASTAPAVLPWIEDDYPKAVALARARKVPLFVEAWAPWCHTCRSMKAYVFTDPALARHARDFVWLDLNSEQPQNASFRKRYPLEALPTIYLIDPVKEQATLRWIGGATVGQLHALLDDAHGGGGASTELLVQIARADSLFGAGDNAGAAAAYGEVLASAPAGWRGAPRVIEARLYALAQSEQYDAGIALARATLPTLGRSLPGMNVAGSALDCALSLADSLPQRRAAIAEFEAATRALVTDHSFEAAADDRSGAYIELLTAREDAKDDAGHRAVAEEWAAFLDGEAAKAKSPDQRAVFDSHRLSAAIELGQPERAVPMLQLSERELPDDYNPPARLASAYKAMKRWDDALAASDRAMAKSYGPRKLLIYQTRADIFVGRGDPAKARQTLEDAIRYAEHLPPGQRSDRTIASLKKKLEGIPTTAASN